MTGPRTSKALSGANHDALNGTIGTDTHDIELDDSLNKSISLGADTSLDDLRDQLNAKVSHDVNDPHLQKFMTDAAFMEEHVLVRVATSTDPTATKIVETWCNGIPQRFIRGEFVKARRKYVEVLARAKPFSVTTPEVIDANGDRTTVMRTTSGLLYPFEMNDPNPMGQHWLRRVLQEA